MTDSPALASQRTIWTREYGALEAEVLVDEALALADEWGELGIGGAIKEVSRQRSQREHQD